MGIHSRIFHGLEISFENFYLQKFCNKQTTQGCQNSWLFRGRLGAKIAFHEINDE